MADASHFGTRLKRARTGRLSQEQLAEISGISPSTVKRIEKTGKAKAAQKKGLALVLVEEGASATHFAEELGSLLTASELENVSLRRDVDLLDRRLRGLADILVGAGLVADEEIDRLLGPLVTNEPPRDEAPGEGEGRQLG